MILMVIVLMGMHNVFMHVSVRMPLRPACLS